MAETDAQDQPLEGNTTAEGGELVIQKIYVKDLSFETPHSPAIFAEKWVPDTKLQLRSTTTVHGQGVHEVILTLNVTAQLGEKTAYLVEVQQAGIFNVKGFTQEQLGPMMGSYCPNLLFPFAREVVASLVAKGGFPQLLLSPVNFDALYAHMQAQNAQAQKAQGQTSH